MTVRRPNRPGTSSARRPAAGRDAAADRPGSGRVTTRPPSGRRGRPSTALTPREDAEIDEAEEAAAEDAGPRRSKHAQPGNFKTYVMIALVVVAIGAIIAYFPIRRSMILGKMDEAKGAEAIEHAKEFLIFTDKDAGYVTNAIRTNRGPFEAQLYLAEQCLLFSPGLMTIAERVAPPLEPAQLALTLNTGSEIWDKKGRSGDRMPSMLEDWALKHEDRDVAIAALHLMERSGDAEAPRVLMEVARKPGQDPVRVAAALDSLSGLLTGRNLGYACNLLASNAADQVVQHAGMRNRMIQLAGPDHLKLLLDLLDSTATSAVRALVLEALGGPAMQMPDGANASQRRQDIGVRIAAKISADEPAEECAAALRAAKHLRLYGARDAVLAIVPSALAEPAPLVGINAEFLAECLGKAFIFTEPEEARAASEDLIVKLTKTLDDPVSRPVAANALGHITEPSFLRLRLALDKLCALGEDPACFAALRSIVNRTYSRQDVTKANGDDLGKWSKYLAADLPRYKFYLDAVEWHDANQMFQRVSDGRTILDRNKQHIRKVTEELNLWLESPDFAAPLGLGPKDVSSLLKRMNELGRLVQQSLAGALQ
ncbi:MAG: hypothetical protein H0X45_12010 [Planctomycetes bacterium]|nr:hypothetical protein [Planctomycetota bacterium]